MSTAKNTIIIFDQLGEADIIFFICPSDESELNNIYINAGKNNELEEKLINLIDYDENGVPVLDSSTRFPYDKYIPGETAVIVCGFIP